LANYAEVPTYEKLDCILVTIDLEQKFSLASVQALTREISDHTPLLLDTGEPSHRGNARNFRFELAWLTSDGFFELVKEIWESKNRGGLLWRNGTTKLGDYDASLGVGLGIYPKKSINLTCWLR
jgi:hypothetical protein